mgnify:CR=1 FL=1
MSSNRPTLGIALFLVLLVVYATHAKNFFTNQVAPFHEKQMGANGGGPVMRDRMHFFASYEYQSRAVTARPNTGFAQFDVDASQDITRHYTTGRVDTQLNQAHRLFARTSKYDWEQLNVAVGGRTVAHGIFQKRRLFESVQAAIVFEPVVVFRRVRLFHVRPYLSQTLWRRQPRHALCGGRRDTPD